MDNIYLLFILLSPVLLLVGLIKPSLFSKFPIKNLNRKKLSAMFVALFLFSFVGFGMTTDLDSSTEDNVAEVLSDQHQVSSSEKDTSNVVIKRVIDGDTVETEAGSKIRYIGIDTPETVHPSKPVECFGEEASKKNRELVEGKEVRLEKDVSETDKYGRLLRYVWIGDTMINELLIREGYAQSSSYPPDIKYQDKFIESQRKAREEKKGLWGSVCDNWDNVTPTPKSDTTDVQKTPTIPPSGESWSCDCSKTCSNMSSCAEAQYQLNVCGCTKRDGDKDGIACDSDCQ